MAATSSSPDGMASAPGCTVSTLSAAAAAAAAAADPSGRPTVAAAATVAASAADGINPHHHHHHLLLPLLLLLWMPMCPQPSLEQTCVSQHLLLLMPLLQLLVGLEAEQQTEGSQRSSSEGNTQMILCSDFPENTFSIEELFILLPLVFKLLLLLVA